MENGISKDNKHQKHAHVNKPDLGEFGRNEWAILGAPCGKIKNLAHRISELIGGGLNVGYVDADHQHGDTMESAEKNAALVHAATMEYTDKIHFHRLDFKSKLEKYQYRILFNEADVVLVNGNHFQASRQIVLIDPKKEDSLKRKLDRLTRVDAIVMTSDATAIPEFLKAHLPDLKRIPVFKFEDSRGISHLIQNAVEENTPPLFGLVLAGGKSQRMGQDKGKIKYYQKPQREYMYELLSGYCHETFISCRQDQLKEIPDEFQALPDSFDGLGPFGAILSAQRYNPNAAWLVIAVDLPLLDEPTLSQLIENRDVSKIATAFQSPVNEFPEPLITIWEPKSYGVLLQFLAQGFSCPRKVLINSNIRLLEANDPKALLNVNSPEELEKVMQKIKQE